MGDEVSIHRNYWQQAKQYFSDVRVEMRRVTWPGKQEVYGTTIMVLLTTFLFGIYFWVCDQAFQFSVGRVLKFFLHRS